MAEIAFANDRGNPGVLLGERPDSLVPSIPNTSDTFGITSPEGLTDAKAAARRARGEGNHVVAR
jgi:hypothetical protein